MRRVVRALVVAALPAALSPLGAARPPHPVHTTLTEITLDERARTVRVAVRGFREDVAAAAAAHGGIRTAATDSGIPDAAAAAYLLAKLRLVGPDGRPVDLRWEGSEERGEVLWMYFEGPLAGGLRGARVRNDLLFERFDDQVNLVQARYGGRRATLLFTRGDAAKRLP